MTRMLNIIIISLTFLLLGVFLSGVGGVWVVDFGDIDLSAIEEDDLEDNDYHIEEEEQNEDDDDDGE